MSFKKEMRPNQKPLNSPYIVIKPEARYDGRQSYIISIIYGEFCIFVPYSIVLID